MGNIAHTVDRACKYAYRNGAVVYTYILRNLVIGTLYKCAVYCVQRLSAACCNSRSHSRRIFFRNSYIYKLSACLISSAFPEAAYCGSTGGQNAYAFVLLHFFKKHLSCKVAVILAVIIVLCLACFNVKRHMPVPVLLVFFRKRQTLSLFGNYMHCDRTLAVLYLTESGDKTFNIVAVLYEHIVKTHSCEQVRICFSVAITQSLEIFVHTAVVFSDRHIVIVYNNDKISVKFACVVDSLKSLAAAERTIAYYRNNVSAFVL